ncbi:MAG: condensation domain-containing protein, partial [Chitinophagaceae bacterium]
MKDDLLNKVRTFRTANDLLYLLNPDEKHSAIVKICLPSNEDESTLYAIWKSLLGHDNFGVKDNFFQVGGNSLKAVQLISRISRDFAVQIQLTEVFLQPTIEQLARHILAQKKGELPISIFGSQPRPKHIPLSFSQAQLWFIDRLEGSVQYHIPEVFRLRGHLDIHALEYAFQQIIKRHEVLRTVIRGEEGKEYQFIKEKDVWQLGIIDGSVYKENTEGLQLCITNLINSPFDLSNDDMMRGNLIILDEQENILVITMHHIASDGWSIAILFKELTEFYSVYIKKVTSEVAPLSLQYADYAIWQRQHLQGELFDKKLQYWKQKLQGVTSLQLPTDFQRHAEQTINGAGIHFKIDQDLVKQLQELSKQQGATLFMTTLAAFKVLLYRYTAQEDICVGTAIANRTRHEVEDLIGFFVNTLALRNEVNGETSFTELLQKVKKTTIEAYENQEVPFEKVVEAVVKERDRSRNPLFQVMFVWQNTPEVSDLRLG